MQWFVTIVLQFSVFLLIEIILNVSFVWLKTSYEKAFEWTQNALDFFMFELFSGKKLQRSNQLVQKKEVKKEWRNEYFCKIT